MLSAILIVVAISGSGIVAGVFVAVALSVLPALCTLPAGRYIEMHKELGKGYHPAMPLIVNATMFADIGLVFLTGHGGGALYAGAAVLTLGVQAVSHLANVPINRRVVAVDPRVVPADWSDPRPLWRSWHRLRTGLALAVLLINAAATALAVS